MQTLARIRSWLGANLRNINGFDALREMVASAHREMVEMVASAHRDVLRLEEQLLEAERIHDLRYRDLMLLLAAREAGLSIKTFEVITDFPVALASDDHKVPLGTLNDNTRCPRFVAACERVLQKPLRFMDLGCAGGGLVLDFLLRGHEAIGLEGSDLSLRTLRAEWRVLPHNLFTCDVTKPFFVRRATEQASAVFDVVSAWEVLEHLSEGELPQFFENVHRHLSPEGFFVGSIATFPCEAPETGAQYHRTVQARGWWEGRFQESGLAFLDDHPFTLRDFFRGTGNGPDDWDACKDPNLGFHFVARKVHGCEDDLQQR